MSACAECTRLAVIASRLERTVEGQRATIANQTQTINNFRNVIKTLRRDPAIRRHIRCNHRALLAEVEP